MSSTRLSVSCFLSVLVAVLAAGTALAEVKSPPPGSVYREIKIHIPNSGNKWRVTDPNATFVGSPGNSPEDFLPNPVMNFSIPSGALNGALSAEVVIDYWGGHVGTINQRLKFNNKPWRSLPELDNTPTAPECYTQQWNPSVAIPLGDLKHGGNTIQGTSGGQTCFNFRWGQWGWYGVVLRIYYNPDSVSHPGGSITSPGNNATIGENPTVRVATSGSVRSVEVFARYDGPDWDGDGDFLEYHQAYHRPKNASQLDASGHVGTDGSSPFNIVWDTELVPSQNNIKVLARIEGTNGLWYVTPARSGIRLQRGNGAVFHFKPFDVPRRFWVRNNNGQRNLKSKINIPSSINLNQINWAKMIVRTWNGVDGGSEPGQTHGTWFNGRRVTQNYGANHHYSVDVVPINVSWLQHGTNEFKFDSNSTHHGIEILWPGPELVVGTTQASSNGECGDGVQDPGEDCDDGNNVDGDGCDSDCTNSGDGGDGECGDGVQDPGEQCDDGNTNDGDGCQADCTLPTSSSDLPAMYPFEGSGSTIEDIANDNDGSLVGNGDRTNGGRYGKAVVFNGNSGHVNLGPLNLGGPFTIAMWFKAHDFGVADARLISKATGTADSAHFFMVSTIEDGGKRLRFRLKTTSGGTTTLIADGATVPAGDWVHVAAVWTGSQMRIFQNGTLVGNVAKSGAAVGDSTVEVWVGDQTNGGKPFDGEIDELVIDDRAYSAADVVDLMSAPLAVGGPDCGNGMLDPGEECDDGNNVDGDGCDADCTEPDGPPPGDNVLRNADFEDGTAEWTHYTGGSGTFAAPGGEARVRVTSASSNVQVYQRNVEVAGGTEYRLQFRARANRERAIRIDLRRHGAPYNSYGLSQSFTIGTAMATYETTFTTTNGDKTDGRFMIWLASDIADGDELFFDDIVVGLPSNCGDGVTDPGEECDDGNSAPGDGCDGLCRMEACGNGRVDAGEECDDGNMVDGDGCQGNCMAPECGDGIVDPGEDCDDGNTVDGDGCQGNCALPGCGDGIVDADEGCDDGNTVDGDGCQSNCALPGCGDGIVDPGEECDDGNDVDDDDCSNTCVQNEPDFVNIVRNGDFADGTAQWKFYTSGSGNFSADDGFAECSISTLASNIQLYQRNVSVAGGTTHRLRFRARNTFGADMDVWLRKHGSPYTLYGLDAFVDLTDEWQTFEIDFTTTAGDKTDGRLTFWFGSHELPGSSYEIDDVELFELP